MKKKQKEIELKIQKFFSEVMRAIGFVFLFAFSMIGAITYYTSKNTPKIIGYGFDIQIIFLASVVVIMCYAMTQVEDRW